MTQEQMQQDMDWESHYVALIQACDDDFDKCKVLLELISFLGYDRVVEAYLKQKDGR